MAYELVAYISYLIKNAGIIKTVDLRQGNHKDYEDEIHARNRLSLRVFIKMLLLWILVNSVQNVAKIFKLRITHLDICDARECRISKHQLFKKLNSLGFYSSPHISIKRNVYPDISWPTFYSLCYSGCSTCEHVWMWKFEPRTLR